MEKVEEKYEFNQDPILDGSILVLIPYLLIIT